MDQTSAAQLDMQDQHGRKASPPIPEDLVEVHQQCLDFLRHPGEPSSKPIEWCVQLIERIGRVEQERNQLRATRLEDGLTIANQRTLLDKYDADNTALNAREKLLLDALRKTTGFVVSFDDMDQAKALLAQFDAEEHQ